MEPREFSIRLRSIASSIEKSNRPDKTSVYQNIKSMIAAIEKPKYETMMCNSCGGDFGPGNQKFEECEDHEGLIDSSKPGEDYDD